MSNRVQIVDNDKYYKHLSLADRAFIEQALNNNESYHRIAVSLRKDPSTIAKHVKTTRTKKVLTSYNGSLNFCVHRQYCIKQHACKKPGCNLNCRFCKDCNLYCDEYEEIVCPKLLKPPYVCNGCTTKPGCRKIKYYYYADASYRKYRDQLVSSRVGVNMTKEKLYEIDHLVSPLLIQGQSVAMIYQSHKTDLPFTSRTLYNLVERNYLAARNSDLPRKPAFKVRKPYIKREKVETKIREERRYHNFLEYTASHPEVRIAEMDTVIGAVGGKVLLTLYLRDVKLMLAFLLQNKQAQNVVEVFNHLEEWLGLELFQKTFPIILTDNGSEFSSVDQLEINHNGEFRTKIFYCDGYASYQKGGIEKNHEYLRYILPKRTSFDDLTQQQVDLMINHINSVKRVSLNGHSPFELASLLLGKDILDRLHVKCIDPDDIILKPNLMTNHH